MIDWISIKTIRVFLYIRVDKTESFSWKRFMMEIMLPNREQTNYKKLARKYEVVKSEAKDHDNGIIQISTWARPD